ncbi:PREDICTED: mitochondrial import receptor subunit TOM40 homolog 2-like [Dufourea novaeangliae]|uniref:Mitochondrial import receptor subunit TOM40 like protein 2 n=1 Tax=Dufourea novaeangliae TaxID=178035 RepID=A0A154PCY6_DUFNO|nr:PREDICTED: mitochondrial import receptor subunit TOM40 homolog 2-like [Dufourea novaeangliae]KZC09118.1 Mitochondrial import receptor subunit TOM40 like protein 2 [Dufourea novaeangliae]
MGMVHASAKKEETIPSVVSDEKDCVPCVEPQDKGPGNPGSFDELHKPVKNLYPQNFEGARLIIKKVLNKHFSVTHSITMSSVTPSGYKFGAKYVGTKMVGPNEQYPVAVGEITPNGNLSASFMHTLGCRFRYKLSAQIADGKCKASSSTAEYRANDFTIAVTLANPRFPKKHGTVVLHYLQSITSRITLGAELACLRGSKIPGGQQTVMCAAFRHSTGHTTLSGTIGEAGFHVCYHRKASSQLELGVELETNLRTHHSIATIVYKLNVPYADLVFRGIVNSETTVGAVFEKRLYPIPESSLVISGLLNHRKQQFRVGVGLNIGQ